MVANAIYSSAKVVMEVWNPLPRFDVNFLDAVFFFITVWMVIFYDMVSKRVMFVLIVF